VALPLRRSPSPALPALLALALTLALPAAPGATSLAAQDPPAVGPPEGSLVVVGGAMSDPAIYARFLELAGGPDAPIVYIPTAGGGEEYDDTCRCLVGWHENGARNITVLHTWDRAEADSEAFVEPLREARGVFFGGGRQWRLVDAYGGTLTETAIREVLERGGVVGGSSAGASIQASFLVRGDTETNTIMMGDHQEGFGYLRNVGIDQHVLQRNRHFDLLEVVEAHPELLGLGIDENTALVVQGDEAEVIGASYVLVYGSGVEVGDHGGPFYFLAPGDRFNLATREARPPTRSFTEVPNVRVSGGGG